MSDVVGRWGDIYNELGRMFQHGWPTPSGASSGAGDRAVAAAVLVLAEQQTEGARLAANTQSVADARAIVSLASVALACREGRVTA